MLDDAAARAAVAAAAFEDPREKDEGGEEVVGEVGRLEGW